MKNLLLYSSICLLSIVCVSCSGNGELCTAEPEYFRQGTRVRITYDPSLSPLEGEINGVWYAWKDYRWEASDMVLKKRGGVLKTEFTVPEGAALVVWKFYDRDTVDIGGPGFQYARYVLTDEGRNMPSANIGWAFLRGENTRELAGIPSLEGAGFETKADEVVKMWINNELRDNPAELRNVFWFATLGLQKDSTASAENMRKNLETVLMSDAGEPLSEEQLMKIHYLSSSVVADPGMKARVEEILAERYPDGQFFREQEARKLFMGDKGEGFDAKFEAYLKRFPPQKFEDVFVENDMFGHFYGDLFRIYVYTPVIRNDDYSRLMDCLDIVPRGNLATYFWHLVSIPYSRGDASAQKLYPYAKAIIEEMQGRQRTSGEMVWSPREWRERTYSTNRNGFLDYCRILDEVGQSSHALALADTLSVYFGTGSAEFNDFYSALMADGGRQTEAVSLIKAAVADNQATPRMLEVLRRDYLDGGGAESGFEDYVNSLKSEALLAAQREHLKASMINEPTRLFALETLEGGRVDMSKLKGHIIVLDFWATWCGPCKAAMPGMQMAVDRFKDDPKVDFFFISTMEHSKDYVQTIKSFIAEKGYDFQVLLDNPDEKGRRQAVYSHYAAQFGFSGIPQKMIIDGNGNVRWVATGYYGSPTALADEISIVIDEIRK